MAVSVIFAASFGQIRSQIVNCIKRLDVKDNVVNEIRQRRLTWLGHVLRMDQNRIPKVALRWTPPGKRKSGRPKMTWRRTVVAELAEMGLSWGEAQHAAQDRAMWKQRVAALCHTSGEEDK
jgi:hypothetical protein